MASLEELRLERERKADELRAAGLNPYPATTKRTHSIGDVAADFDSLQDDTAVVTIAGRVMALRGQGALVFAELFDGTGRMQVMLKRDDMDASRHELFVATVDIGDFVEVSGTVALSKRGERTVFATDWSMLTKSLRPLPDKWHGLTDEDERLRKRYLDMLLSEDLRSLFVRRMKFWDSTRRFMVDRGFLEVETPTLEVTTGGAEARPFQTHHNDFDINVYLRISVGELWQKRLMAGGFAKTFEIGRVYRNEGTSPQHLQEFTNMEFYWSFANYSDGMKLVQDLYQTIAREVYGTTKFHFGDQTIDLAGEWPTVDYVEEVKRQTGVDILADSDDVLREALKDRKVAYEGSNRERLMDSLWKFCRQSIPGPAFLIHHPRLVSPLAKSLADDAQRTERFQVILGGTEIGNGYSELNDPREQRERFSAQQDLLKAGDEEAMMPDWDFVEVLEQGIPPTCGFGFGERLFAFLEGKPLRECQTFPLVRPKPVTE
jgi:lysyl-tRNA synthetase class 2